MSSPTPIDDVAELRTHYHDPVPAVLHKARPVIDPAAAALIAVAPFVVVATSSPEGNDASPRGGPPGFVKTLDAHRLAFGDLAGNNRLDTYTNLVTHPAVGLLFLVPGLEETLRVNGRASVVTDPAVLEATRIDARLPKVAVVIEVEECYIHCGKAVRRGGLWKPDSWLPAEQIPTAGEVIVDQFDLDIDAAAIDTDLAAGYEATLWEEGGK